MTFNLVCYRIQNRKSAIASPRIDFLLKIRDYSIF